MQIMHAGCNSFSIPEGEYALGPSPKNMPQGCACREMTKAEISETVADFVKRYEAKFGKKPRSLFFAPCGYDTALMFLNAMKAVGTDGEKIRDYCETHVLKGVQATYTFSDLDHSGIGVDQASVMMIQGGDWVPAD